VLVLLGVASGSLTGVQLAGIWGLRRAKGVGPGLALVALVVLPIAYYWSAEAFGWPTPGSIAESSGLVPRLVDRGLLLGIGAGTAVLVVATLVRSGVTRRLESWSATAG
jgi:hypothetical protein